MRKTIVVLLFCLCMVLVACNVPQNSPPLQETPQSVDALLACEDNQRIIVGDYILFNNVWNKAEWTDYMQCVFAQTDTPPTVMGWRWDWPGTGRQIKA